MSGNVSKVARIQNKYSIEGLGDELVNRYTQEGASLRDLARYVNFEVTKEVLKNTRFSAFEVYETLKDPNEEYGERDKSELRRELRLEGINVGELEDDWVSHMSVRTYLRNESGISTEREKKLPIKPQVAMDQIQGLMSREENIIRNTLTSVEGIESEKWDLYTEVYVRNIESGESIRLEEFLKDLNK